MQSGKYKKKEPIFKMFAQNKHSPSQKKKNSQAVAGRTDCDISTVEEPPSMKRDAAGLRDDTPKMCFVSASEIEVRRSSKRRPAEKYRVEPTPSTRL